MKHPVQSERGKKYVGLPEFARVGEEILSELGFEQKRGTVSAVPDERTIRYYLSEGLIQPADEKQGTASVFGYLHLLQLLVVKKLQADHLPIRKIRELVSGKDEQQLESLLGLAGGPGKKPSETEAKRYLESLLTLPPISHSSGPAPRAPSASLSQSVGSPVPAGEQNPSWQRVEIEPGFELHIRSDYAPPKTSAKTRNLAERVIHRLRRLNRSADKE